MKKALFIYNPNAGKGLLKPKLSAGRVRTTLRMADKSPVNRDMKADKERNRKSPVLTN